MSIEIKTDKVWQGNVHCRKILGFKALGYKEVPKGYISLFHPSAALNEDTGALHITLRRPVWNISGVFKLQVGQVIPQKEFAKLMKDVKAAGHRLMTMKKEIWSGRQTFRV